MSKKNNTREAQCAAMQDLLNVSAKMRKMGIKPYSINERLRPAMHEFKMGRYERAKDYAHTTMFTGVRI